MGGTKRDGGPVRVFAISVIFAALHGALRSLANEFARHGYAILFGLVAAESFWFPLPGELSLLASGYEASRGKLDVFWVAGVAMAAAVTGDNLAYLVGRLAGRPLIERLARLLHVRSRRVASMDHYFDRHAGKTIVTARWISPLRGLVALSAGAAHVPWRRFFVFNAIGSITWAGAVTGLAYGLSRSLGELVEIFDVSGLVIGGVLVAAIIIGSFVWWRRRRARRVIAQLQSDPSSDAPPQPEVDTNAPDADAVADTPGADETQAPACQACSQSAAESCAAASSGSEDSTRLH
jgi:membrane protein DedA with SNARE-associated domain